MIRCLSLEATESFSKLMAALSSLRPIMENWLPSGHGKEKGVACCTALSASVETKTITWRRRSVNLSCNLFYGWRSKRTEGLCALLKQVASRNVATGFPWMQYLTAPPPPAFCQVAPNITPLSISLPGGDKHNIYFPKNTICNDQYNILDLRLDTSAFLFPYESYEREILYFSTNWQ